MYKYANLAVTLFFCIALFLTGCETNTTVTTNGNTELNNNLDTTNVNAENSDADESAASMTEVKEPETYQAKVNMNFVTMGERGNMTLPKPLVAEVARKDGSKRMEFNLPNGQKLIYLELNGKNLVILPDRKQYAELNEQSTGFQVRDLMTPGQMVKQIKNLKGVEKVGEEKVGSRDAVKYRYAADTQTDTKAGDVETDSFILVDKETGLPLRTEMASKSDAQIQGFRGLRIVTEMTDIKTEVSDDLFKEPEGFEKVEEEQIRQQIGLLFNAASQIIAQLMQSSNTN